MNTTKSQQPGLNAAFVCVDGAKNPKQETGWQETRSQIWSHGKRRTVQSQQKKQHMIMLHKNYFLVLSAQKKLIYNKIFFH